MIKAIVSLIAFFLLTQPIHAQSIDVLSGEHGDFSRLVMQFPEPVDWVFGRTDQGYEFGVPDTGYTFDLDQVFQRIPRTRIQAVETEKGRLSLSVSGRFHADVFELREGRLVIDIKDGPPPANSLYERPISPTVTETTVQGPEPEIENVSQRETATADSTLISDGEGDHQLGWSYADDISQTPLSLPLVPLRPSPEAAPQQVFLEQEDFPETSPRVEALEQQLLEQIGRAVSQGILEADVTKTENIVDQATSYGEAPSEPSPAATPDQKDPEPMPAPQERAEPQSHMRIQSALTQRDDGHPATSERTDAYGTLCLDPHVLDVSTWGQALEDGLKISEYRQATVGEFDQPSAEGVRDLAKYYLYLTFGAEAKSVLTNFDLRSDEEAILFEMADIMDRGYATESGSLSAQFRCDGPNAFWSAMAKREFLPSEELNLESILSTFSALPLHMRRHLGPTLSERFLAVGDAQTAKSIQNAIARAEGDHGDAFDLLNAELSMLDGATSKAEGELEQLISHDGPEAPKALVKLIESQASREQRVERRLAEAAEAMMVEFRNDEFETDLQDAAILARIYSGDVDMALKRSLQRGLQQDEHLIAQALNIVNAHPSDAEFSKIILGNLSGLTQSDIPEAERMRVVSRLMNLGFYQEALNLMAGSSRMEDDASRLVLAQAFYGLGEMDAALRYASQLQTAEAAEIASKAYFYRDNPERALTLSKDAGLTENIGPYALAAEDWESLADAEAGALSELGKVVTDRDAATGREPNAPESLGDLRDDLAESEKLRTALENIIN